MPIIINKWLFHSFKSVAVVIKTVQPIIYLLKYVFSFCDDYSLSKNNLLNTDACFLKIKTISR